MDSLEAVGFLFEQGTLFGSVLESETRKSFPQMGFGRLCQWLVQILFLACLEAYRVHWRLVLGHLIAGLALAVVEEDRVELVPSKLLAALSPVWQHLGVLEEHQWELLAVALTQALLHSGHCHLHQVVHSHAHNQVPLHFPAQEVLGVSLALVMSIHLES
jgi:hypothetical protein